MIMKWNLEELFTNTESFYKEIEYIKKLILNIKKYESVVPDAFLLEQILTLKWQIKEMANTILVYGSLRYYKNIKSDECLKLKKDAEEFFNDVDISLKFVDQMIIRLGEEKIKAYLKENTKLEPYRFGLMNLFRLQSHLQNDEVNQKIKVKNNKINEDLTLYNSKIHDMKYGSIFVDEEEIVITPSNFAKYITARDRNVRQKTYLTVNKSFLEEQTFFARILNDIYKQRLDISFLENYSSVLEQTLFEENIDAKIITSLIKMIHENLKVSQEYLKMKANYFGIQNPHLYDFGMAITNSSSKKYDLEEAKTIILNALSPLGNRYQEIVKKLFEGHIDADLDENKHPSITFSWNTYSFLNFKGAYGDLKNMIHEIGHIVNYYLSKEHQPFMYEDSTIFVGETASLVNEILLNRYLSENATTIDEKIFYLSKEIENYYTTIFKQVMYTEFEMNLYHLAKEKELTPNLIRKAYQKIIHKYYGESVVYDEESDIEWTRLGHLYRWSYYPYKYATGLIMASSIVDSLFSAKSLTTKDYLNFLSLGSSDDSLTLLKKINIDLLDKQVLQKGLNVMKDDVMLLQLLLKEKTQS